MDKKGGLILNPQLNSINGIIYPNNYNLLIQNHLQINPKLQKKNENLSELSIQNKVENDKENEPHIQKRKRTTKKESDIRNYKCSLCDKSYLSYPALYTHCKQKHNTNNHSGRGRGRPKKEPTELSPEKKKYDPLTTAYFLKEERTGITKYENIKECAINAFKFLYSNESTEVNIKEKIKERKMKEYLKIEEHPFLGRFLKDKHDINMNYEDEKIPTDLVLINYLNKMSVHCNEKYYEKLIVFVTLFREHINIINKDKVKNSKEFSEVIDAEDVPESSNEFITDFLYPDEQEKEFNICKEESIDLTINLCNWMYMNNFTCSKLFLLDKDK
jgi:hypothetical protein